jgi:hypothetical protein
MTPCRTLHVVRPLADTRSPLHNKRCHAPCTMCSLRRLLPVTAFSVLAEDHYLCWRMKTVPTASNINAHPYTGFCPHEYLIGNSFCLRFSKPATMAVSALEAALIETWTLFAVGTIFIILRVFSRTRLVGFAGYCADDYLIFFAWVSYQILGDNETRG